MASDGGWFALGGVALAFVGNLLLEIYKTKNQFKIEEAKSVEKARIEGFPALINFCDRIMRGYDPTDKPDYRWFHSFCQDAENLRAYYVGFDKDTVNTFERLYMFISLANDIGHPEYEMDDVEIYFENEFVDEVAKLRKFALDAISARQKLG